MSSISIFRNLLIAAAILVVVIFFLYPTSTFPLGLEALECLMSFFILVILVFLTIKLQPKLERSYTRATLFGLYIGLLWTIEISINNFIQPGLPLRDIIDDIFWGIIACIILMLSILVSYQTNKIFNGIKVGFISGLSSGAVACFTALLLICFGMSFILKDPLNIEEWTNMRNKTHYPGMAVYFAYQTLAGAMLHLLVLGGIMGVLLGIVGGLTGKAFNVFRKHKSAVNGE